MYVVLTSTPVRSTTLKTVEIHGNTKKYIDNFYLTSHILYLEQARFMTIPISKLPLITGANENPGTLIAIVRADQLKKNPSQTLFVESYLYSFLLRKKREELIHM
jgi:hypothetical protein